MFLFAARLVPRPSSRCHHVERCPRARSAPRRGSPGARPGKARRRGGGGGRRRSGSCRFLSRQKESRAFGASPFKRPLLCALFSLWPPGDAAAGLALAGHDCAVFFTSREAQNDFGAKKKKTPKPRKMDPPQFTSSLINAHRGCLRAEYEGGGFSDVLEDAGRFFDGPIWVIAR